MWDSLPHPFVTKIGVKIPEKEQKNFFGNKCSFFHSGGFGGKNAKSRGCVSSGGDPQVRRRLPFSAVGCFFIE
jgi:hypothetical protein